MKQCSSLSRLGGGISIFCLVTISPVQAQIVSDGTVGTIVNNPSGNIFEITGGTPAGSNLFHSFDQFSVPNGDVISFINNNLNIQNVISRVTGQGAAYISNINGVIVYSTEKGNKVTTETYGHRVCNAFRRFIGSPVNPHLLRHILITYAYERGMTDAEKRSLAICQQHSEETQARIYNEQEMLNSLQPALKLNQKFLKEFYQSFNLNDLDPT